METAQQIRHISMELNELKQDINKMITANFVDFLPRVFDNVTILHNCKYLES